MASLTNFIFILSIATAAAFSPVSSVVGRQQTRVDPLKESFGFDFAESQEENTPDIILGEANYKQWVGDNVDNAFLNRQYDVVRRVRELDIIGKVADYEILTKLEKNGLTLKVIEKLLPLGDTLGVASVVGKNQQLLINGIAPLVIEGTPFILPVAAAALDIGPLSFFGASAALGGVEALLVIEKVKIPFVGLDAGFYLGLLLVPLAALLAAVGAFFLTLPNDE